VRYLQAEYPFCHPTSSRKALKEKELKIMYSNFVFSLEFISLLQLFNAEPFTLIHCQELKLFILIVSK